MHQKNTHKQKCMSQCDPSHIGQIHNYHMTRHDTHLTFAYFPFLLSITCPTLQSVGQLHKQGVGKVQLIFPKAPSTTCVNDERNNRNSKWQLKIIHVATWLRWVFQHMLNKVSDVVQKSCPKLHHYTQNYKTYLRSWFCQSVRSRNHCGPDMVVILTI